MEVEKYRRGRNKSEMHKMWKERHSNRREDTRERVEEDPVPRMWDRQEETMVKLGSGNIP